MGRRTRGAGRAVRRGVALGLTGAALWCMSWAADLTGWLGRAKAAGEEPAVAVALLSSQLEGGARTDKLSGWGRLLLEQSALLRAGVGSAAEPPAPEEQPEPSSSEEHEEDREEPQLSHQEDDGIIEMTAQGKSGGKYLYGQGVYLYNRTNYDLDESVLTQGSVDVDLGEGPQILIVHTHGSEGYTPVPGTEVVWSGDCRTTDTRYNVVHMGDAIAEELGKAGISVLHDRTLYDYPEYAGAYDRALPAIEAALKQYPSIHFVLDVHRDAIEDSAGNQIKVVSDIDGVGTAAQLSLVVGSDGGGLSHPDWIENLRLAAAVQEQVLTDYPTLMRPLLLRNSRYNQHATHGSLLLEVGTAGNAPEEAELSARLFARELVQVLEERSK